MCKEYRGAISTHDAVILTVRNTFIGRYVIKHRKIYNLFSCAYRAYKLFSAIFCTGRRLDECRGLPIVIMYADGGGASRAYKPLLSVRKECLGIIGAKSWDRRLTICRADAAD